MVPEETTSFVIHELQIRVSIEYETVSKVHRLPLTVPSGVLLLREEEKVNTLLISNFPSF
jgi:hypothetical protein